MAGRSRLWPAAFSFSGTGAIGFAAIGFAAIGFAAIGFAADGATSGIDIGVSLLGGVGLETARSGSKGRLVFHTAKTRWRSFRMQWPRATSPRLPLALRRAYRARR